MIEGTKLMPVVRASSPAIESAVNELVSVQHWNDCSFIRLPIAYPSGSLVTVKVDVCERGRFRVSDGGLGYREVEDVGGEGSFPRTATAIVEEGALAKGAQSIFTEATADQLTRAISDVGLASWQIVTRIYDRLSEEGENDLVEHMTERLEHIFGSSQVKRGVKLTGASTSEWEVSATVRAGKKIVVFQAVGSHGNSVFRANAVFDDLSGLEQPPRLVGVVRSKKGLGSRLGLIARTASIIEEAQADSVYLRAAA